ncbi:MAG: hypothetical protein AB1632_11725 [Nitrospirota bacterium]
MGKFSKRKGARSREMKIPMAGTWTAVVNIMRGGKTSSAKFKLEVH